MNSYIQLSLLALAGGVLSLAGGFVLLKHHSLADGLAKYASPFAAGALLAAVFLDLLKEGLEQTSSDVVLTAALMGMVIFFLAERFLHWFHHHHQHHAEDATKPLIIIGDTVHNAMDGVAIAAAFIISPATGIVTTIAVAAHEIPQEIGDFGLLLAKGMSRRKVMLVNLLSAFSTVITALITFSLGTADVLPLGFLLGLSAGFLLYIAASDIIPEIHAKTPKHTLFDWRPLLLIVGVLVVAISVQFTHRLIDSNHHDAEASQHLHE
jgi:zinc and cadmium transporter